MAFTGGFKILSLSSILFFDALINIHNRDLLLINKKAGSFLIGYFF